MKRRVAADFQPVATVEFRRMKEQREFADAHGRERHGQRTYGQVRLLSIVKPCLRKPRIHPLSAHAFLRLLAIAVEPCTHPLKVVGQLSFAAHDAQFIRCDVAPVRRRRVQRGIDGLARFLCIADPAIRGRASAGIHIADVTLEIRGVQPIAFAHFPSDQSRPIRPALLIAIAHRMRREMIPEQRALGRLAEKRHRVNHRIQPPIRIRGLAPKLRIRAPSLHRAIEIPAHRPLRSQQHSGRRQVRHRRHRRLHAPRHHRRHPRMRHRAPLQEKTQRRGRVRMRASHPHILRRHARRLRHRLLHLAGKLRRHRQQIQRQNKHRCLPQPQRQRPHPPRLADARDLPFIAHRPMKARQLETEWRRDVCNSFSCLDHGLFFGWMVDRRATPFASATAATSAESVNRSW